MSLLDNLVPTWRGVSIGPACRSCDLPVPTVGLVGVGRPFDDYSAGTFCHGHAYLAPRDDLEMRLSGLVPSGDISWLVDALDAYVDDRVERALDRALGRGEHGEE